MKNKEERKYIREALRVLELSKGETITKGKIDYLIDILKLADNQVKNLTIPDVSNSLPTDDAKFIYRLLPDWVKNKAPEGLDPTMYGTLSKDGE